MPPADTSGPRGCRALCGSAGRDPVDLAGPGASEARNLTVLKEPQPCGEAEAPKRVSPGPGRPGLAEAWVPG